MIVSKRQSRIFCKNFSEKVRKNFSGVTENQMPAEQLQRFDQKTKAESFYVIEELNLHPLTFYFLGKRFGDY